MSSHTLIVSDVHLGTPFSKAKNLLELLTKSTFNRLILLGDIFDDLHFTKLSKDQWNILSFIRDHAAESEIIWVRGNHDKKISILLSGIIGAHLYDEFIWQEDDTTYLAVHGDRFDSHLITNKIVSIIITILYYIIGLLQFQRLPIPSWIKSLRTKLLRLTKNSASKAVQYAITKKADVIFCGHTHEAYEHIFTNSNNEIIKYYNSGCWTRVPSTYIAIADGKIEIKYYPELSL